MKEILQKAVQEFPIGTRFICINTSTEAVITTGIFKGNNCENINEINKEGSLIQTMGAYHCIRANGKWAKIIYTPINYSVY